MTAIGLPDPKTGSVTKSRWSRGHAKFAKIVGEYSLSETEFALALDEAAQVLFEGFGEFQMVNRSAMRGVSAKLAGVIRRMEEKAVKDHILIALQAAQNGRSRGDLRNHRHLLAEADARFSMAMAGARDLLAIMVVAETFPREANDPNSSRMARAIASLAAYWARAADASRGCALGSSLKATNESSLLARFVAEALSILGADIDMPVCRAHLIALRDQKRGVQRYL